MRFEMFKQPWKQINSRNNYKHCKPRLSLGPYHCNIANYINDCKSKCLRTVFIHISIYFIYKWTVWLKYFYKTEKETELQHVALWIFSRKMFAVTKAIGKSTGMY
jgi:hypothetical protein